MSRRRPRAGLVPRWIAGTLGLLVLAGAIFIPSARYTDAAWTDSEHAKASFTAMTVAPPTAFECHSRSRGVLGADRYVELTWNASPDAASYDVYLSNTAGTERVLFVGGVSATSIEIADGDLLGGLLANLLAILLGGQPVWVDVVAVHSSTWSSPPTDRKPIVRTGLIPGVLGGLRCQ